MKRKIIMLLLVLVALASVVAVSAADNQTDEISANATEPVAVPDEVEPVSVQDEPCLATGEAIDNRTPTSIVSSDAVGYSTFVSTVTAKLMSNGKTA